MTVLVPLLIGLAYVGLSSLLPEPHRQRFNAVMIAGAGAAYLGSGALGPWEFAFTAAMTYCAFRGLDSWAFIGVGWLLHTGWDVLHHLAGSPLLAVDPLSSFGCAICDPVIALWCLAGGPSAADLARRVRARQRPAT
jgi:hypothetical protein